METRGKIRLREPLDCSIRVTKETRENLNEHKIVWGFPLVESYEMVIRRLLHFIDEIDPDGENMYNWLNYPNFRFQPPKRSRKS